MARHAVAETKIKVTSFFGGSDNQITAQQFRGGRVYAVFGSSDTDLRGATIAHEGATINIIAGFGSVKLLVPEDWGVNAKLDLSSAVSHPNAAPQPRPWANSL